MKLIDNFRDAFDVFLKRKVELVDGCVDKDSKILHEELNNLDSVSGLENNFKRVNSKE